MTIVFRLKNSEKVEAYGCSEKDLTRLVSQFNNGHLMRVKNLCINPNEVISFVGYGNEEKQ
ncbi:hypothetical protein [Streptococcus sp.]